MISSNRTMQALSPTEAAAKAIVHVLGRISDDPSVGWYLGCGTQSFMLLTEALAMLDGGDVLQVRKDFSPMAPKDPASEYANSETTPSLPEEQRELLRAIANYHADMEASLTQAAAVAGQQCAFGLLQKAKLHEYWSEELSTIAAGGGPR